MPKQIVNVHNKLQKDLTKRRDKKCEPIAEQILQILAESKPDLSIKEPEAIHAMYEPIYKKIAAVMLEKNLTLVEVGYTMRILQSVFDSINNLMVKSTQVNFENAQQKLFKMERSDITMRRIHEVLLDLPMTPNDEPLDDGEDMIDESQSEAASATAPSEDKPAEAKAAEEVVPEASGDAPVGE